MILPSSQIVSLEWGEISVAGASLSSGDAETIEPLAASKFFPPVRSSGVPAVSWSQFVFAESRSRAKSGFPYPVSYQNKLIELGGL